MSKYILSLDQGTTGSTAILFNEGGEAISQGYQEIRQIYPSPGWVEHDPQELFGSMISAAKDAIEKANVSSSAIEVLGITNQRETTIVWDRNTGQPVYNAIVWQCRRTAPLCEEYKKRGLEPTVRYKTGLPIDAYFSASKIRWIIDNINDGQKRAERGDLLFGNVDSWLVWNLTGGKVHVTDYSNASRTMLYNIHELKWDAELLSALQIPISMLPEVLPSSSVFGETTDGIFGNSRIPIGGIAGDQQAALFGQACYHDGMAKNTYGTGSFLLVNTGERPVLSHRGLITTLGWGLSGRITYAMEGSIFITGAAIQWLRDGLNIIDNAAESEALAASEEDNGGVYFVPALVGLGAPYWDMYARGTIIGLTRSTSRGHVTRAALEAIAYQVRDVIEAIKEEARMTIPVLRVDGGASVNNLLMQFQADILGVPIQRAQIKETTALGAAYLAGLATGVWKTPSDIEKYWQSSATYEPQMSAEHREHLYNSWKRAVERAKGWIED
jgi:glycerol kinase